MGSSSHSFTERKNDMNNKVIKGDEETARIKAESHISKAGITTIRQ